MDTHMDHFTLDLSHIYPHIPSPSLRMRLGDLKGYYWRTDIPEEPCEDLYTLLLDCAEQAETDFICIVIVLVAINAFRGKYG